jgi:hypothetical protein
MRNVGEHIFKIILDELRIGPFEVLGNSHFNRFFNLYFRKSCGA